MNNKVYLEINKSSEKRGMCFITCLSASSRGGIIGYLSNTGQKCHDLDEKLTGSGDFGTYFNSEEEALECISKFYIIEEKNNQIKGQQWMMTKYT